MNILVITGGSSPERKISLLSARMVAKVLREKKHSVTVFDFKNGLTHLKDLLPKFNLAWPIMHGKEGEDGVLYQFLSSSKIAYVGSSPKGAKTAFDKILFKKYCNRKRLPTAKWKIIANAKGIGKFGFPCVLKGAYGGSSKEVFLLRSGQDLENIQVRKLLRANNKFFVEKLVTGTEITVGVLGGKPLPVLEIIPPKGAWFNYKNKYSGKTLEVPFAPSVSLDVQRKAKKLAMQIHKDLDLGSYSRTDIIVENNIPYIIEINTPGGVGFTAESLLPKAAKAMGMSFGKLVEAILADVSKISADIN